MLGHLAGQWDRSGAVRFGVLSSKMPARLQGALQLFSFSPSTPFIRSAARRPGGGRSAPPTTASPSTRSASSTGSRRCVSSYFIPPCTLPKPPRLPFLSTSIYRHSLARSSALFFDLLLPAFLPACPPPLPVLRPCPYPVLLAFLSSSPTLPYPPHFSSHLRATTLSIHRPSYRSLRPCAPSLLKFIVHSSGSTVLTCLPLPFPPLSTSAYSSLPSCINSTTDSSYGASTYTAADGSHRPTPLKPAVLSRC
jgi:hypothetical protein